VGHQAFRNTSVRILKKIFVVLADLMLKNSVKYLTIADGGIIYLLDVTNRQSLANLTKWFEIFDKHAAMNACILVVASKCDNESARQVKIEEILTFVEEIAKQERFLLRKVLFLIETSAKNNYNLLESIIMISRSVLKPVLELSSPRYKSPNPQDPTKQNNDNKKRCIVM
jgi:GTPase SAR1 family protein